MKINKKRIMSSNKRSQQEPMIGESKPGHQRMQSNPTYLNHMAGLGGAGHVAVKKSKNLSS